jgi:small subunit ribosomal protein S1
MRQGMSPFPNDPSEQNNQHPEQQGAGEPSAANREEQNQPPQTETPEQKDEAATSQPTASTNEQQPAPVGPDQSSEQQPPEKQAEQEQDVSAEISDQELNKAMGDMSSADVEALTSSTPAPQDRFERDKIYEAKVVRVTSEDVFLDLGGKMQGTLPLIEFSGQPLPVVGDTISVIVERFDPDAGLLVLSKRQADEKTFWESVQPGDELEGVVTGMNKGGLDVDIGGARAFMPASQVDVHRVHDISVFIGEHVKCLVSQVDRGTRDLILSRRKYLEKDKKEKRQEVLNSLSEGDVVNGTVTNITDFGAFIDLGGVDGLLHVTDMSWGRVKNPREVVEEGQKVEVQVLRVNKETGKISLGLKQIKPNPWEGVENKYPVGSKVKGRVVRIADFGAFIQLEEGVDALLPLSEMSWSKRVGHPSEILKVGDVPEAEVLSVDPEKKRISLGLKQTLENQWADVESKYPVDTKTTGTVSKLTDFGAFVELDPGVEGLIHISELSDKRVKRPSDVVQEGQEVEVRVVKVDPEAQRIGLSMKKPDEKAPAAERDEGHKKKQKKRKKPLRGGLSSHFEW